MKTILLYQDYGNVHTSDSSFEWLKKHLPKYVIKKTDATSIIHLNHLNENVKALVFPDGHSRHFREKLRGKGNALIRDFVKKGGTFYGSCGGAYYACKEVIFEGDDLKVDNATDNLELFDGKAIGSIAELTKMKYNGTKDSANAVTINYDDKKANIYYNGGPYFEGKNMKVHGTFQDFKDKPAVISGKYGKGKYILSAVHPEITSEELAGCLFDNMSRKTLHLIENIINKMNQSKLDEFSKFLLKDLI